MTQRQREVLAELKELAEGLPNSARRHVMLVRICELLDVPLDASVPAPVSMAPLVNGAEMRRHQSQHAWCSWPARDGFCIPHGLHSQLLGKSGWDDARMRQFYRSVMGKWLGTPIGDSVFRFWENELAAEIGTVTSRPVEGKGHAAVSAARQTLLRRHPELGS